MGCDLLLLSIFILTMFNVEAASIPHNSDGSNKTEEITEQKCLNLSKLSRDSHLNNFRNSSLNNFRELIKCEFSEYVSLWNKTIPTNQSYTLNSSEFCNTTVNQIVQNNFTNHNLSALHHLVNVIFKDYELCFLVCTEYMNKNVSLECTMMKNWTIGKLNKTFPGNKSDEQKPLNIIPSPNAAKANPPSAKASAALIPDQVELAPENTAEVSLPKNDALKKAVQLLKESEKPASITNDRPKPVDLNDENDDSHYFIIFVVLSILCILFYIAIYNKKKILALMIEGRKRKDRRRPASAEYRKLNTNLEEVMPLGNSPPSDSLIY